jgi:hypothetical protein
VSDNGLTFTMRHHGAPIYIDEHVPLRSTRQRYWDDYEAVEIESDTLCIIRDGAVFVHPDRWEFLYELYGATK